MLSPARTSSRKTRAPLASTQPRRPAPSSAESDSHRRARLIKQYKASIKQIEHAKEKYSKQVDERLERRPIGTWERWKNREVDAEVELEAEIELAARERERKQYIKLLIKVETEQARADRRHKDKSRRKLECITLD